VTITSGGANITGINRNAIEAFSNSTGSISITTAASDVLTSGSAGINAYNQATSIPQVGGITTSSITVAARGTINSGTALTGIGARPAGILAGYKGGTSLTPNAAVFGNVIVDDFANITAAGGDGIRAYTYGSGDVTVNDHSGTINAKDMFGITASSYGSGKVSIVTAAGVIINAGSSAIQAINLASAIDVSAASSVSVTANGTIHTGLHLTPSGSQPQAISAGYFPGNVGASNTNVNGTVSIDNFADVTADAGTGINAFNYGNGNVTLINEANTHVYGAQYGITAYSLSTGAGSSGNVTINIGANVTITAGDLYGLSGINSSVNHGGSISITTSTGDIINSGGSGIQANIATASALSSSQISITTAAGFIHSGFDMGTGGGQPAGILAGYTAGSGNTVTPGVHGNVVLDNAAAINADAGAGIILYNYGVGNVSATLEASSIVSGITAGMNIFANGGGNVTVANSGTLTSPSGYGIIAGTGNVLGTTGNGIISITNSGAITSLGALSGAAVVQINNWSTQNASFTNSANAFVTSNLFSKTNLNVAFNFYSGTLSTNTGGVVINNSGQVSGNVTLGGSVLVTGSTFNNNSTGVWKVNGSNWFYGSTNAINNSGLIQATGTTIFNSPVGSTLTFNNSLLVTVGSVAGLLLGLDGPAYTFVGGNVTGANGNFIIGDRAWLEFSGSVAAGPGDSQTVSFRDGNGMLTIDNPSAFHATIAGLAVGDIINLVGGVTSASIVNGGSTLTATLGNSQTVNYQLTGLQSGTFFNLLSGDKIVLAPTTAMVLNDNLRHSFSTASEAFYILANDTITGTGVGFGVNSTDNNPTHLIALQINQTSSISVTGAGVNLATGGANISLINAGSISSSGAAGIVTNSGTGSTDIIDFGNVSGSIVGINARIGGTGPLNIAVGGGATVTGTTSNGIQAISTLGALNISTTSGVIVNSGATGILAQNQGTSVPAGSSAISISTMFGTINASTNGISAGYALGTSTPANIPNPPNTAVNGDINITDNDTAINATNGSGIIAFNYGVGNVSVTSNSAITAIGAGVTTPGVNPTQYGISAFNYGAGSTLVATGFSSNIHSGGSGINIGNQATAVAAAAASTVTVTAQGFIHSGANNNNSGSAPSGIQAGYNPGTASVFNASVFGDVLVNDNASIVADAGDGINAYNYGIGDTVVNVGSGISIQALTAATSSSGKAPYGVSASNYGPGNVAITTSGGATITSGSSGINAVNLSTAIDAGADALVTVTAAGTIHSGTILTNTNAAPSGIAAGFLGGPNAAASNLAVNGTVIVNNAANITADAGIGINAYNFGNGDVTVNDASGTTVQGVLYGIQAHAEGLNASGNVAVNVYSGATVKATSTTAASYGIFALNNGTGNISVITSPGVTISSGSAGINAVNQATAIDQSANSSIVVTAAGTINAGSHLTGNGNVSGGIYAGYLVGTSTPATIPATGVFGDVIVNNTATINTAAGDGIYVYTYGIGDLFVNDLGGNITALGGASPPNGSGVGIVANNYGSGDVRISTAATTVINSDGTGIAALNKAVSGPSFTVPSTSDISVLALGTIHSGSITTERGIYGALSRSSKQRSSSGSPTV